VWANDTAGKTNQTALHDFHVRVNSSIRIFTENENYYPQEDVNLSDETITTTPGIKYAVEVISNN
jgi:hypothetical protein